ncbi:methylcrotonoyl-CoA carboxylase subunit alpha [Rhodotorula diobovata]|uniref:Methylcrotonoyl-CoA carboxylase subunit alpha n=1 Tax=Rhodotorula diobovata TaxID=5288 RepID=A0A5C5G6R1_9BASI|nr:methylcrotonoyl-CoA carboxylase subunit alpha [Rhodotorula diobovata]
MSYVPYDWPTNAKDAVACNSTLTALVESAVGLASKDVSFEMSVAAANCQYSSTNGTVAREARHVWEIVNSYGYTPSATFSIVAVVIFSLSTAFHLYQVVRSRRWWYVAVALGGALQVYGWATRYMASQNIMYGYVIQLAVLTIAPTLFSAAIYALFSMLTAAQDPDLLPRMKPRGYFITFTVVDFVTLVVQAAGSRRLLWDSVLLFKIGCNTMLAGIALQLLATLVFLVVFGLYFRRLARQYPERRVTRLRSRTGLVLWGTLAMAALTIVRGGFRTAELSEGLFSSLSRTQIAIIVLDAVPMILVILLLSATHPLYTVDPLVKQYGTPAEQRWGTYQMETVDRADSTDKELGVRSHVERTSV